MKQSKRKEPSLWDDGFDEARRRHRWHGKRPDSSSSWAGKGNMKRVNKITQQARKAKEPKLPDLDILKGEHPAATVRCLDTSGRAYHVRLGDFVICSVSSDTQLCPELSVVRPKPFHFPRPGETILARVEGEFPTQTKAKRGDFNYSVNGVILRRFVRPEDSDVKDCGLGSVIIKADGEQAAVAIANHLIYYSNVTVHALAKVVAADEYKALNHADPHIYVCKQIMTFPGDGSFQFDVALAFNARLKRVAKKKMACFLRPLSRPEERVEAIGYLQDAAANALKRRKTGTQLVNVKIPVAGPAMLENIVAQVAHVATPIDPKTGQPIPVDKLPAANRFVIELPDRETAAGGSRFLFPARCSFSDLFAAVLGPSGVAQASKRVCKRDADGKAIRKHSEMQTVTVEKAYGGLIVPRHTGSHDVVQFDERPGRIVATKRSGRKGGHVTLELPSYEYGPDGERIASLAGPLAAVPVKRPHRCRAGANTVAKAPPVPEAAPSEPAAAALPAPAAAALPAPAVAAPPAPAAAALPAAAAAAPPAPAPPVAALSAPAAAAHRPLPPYLPPPHPPRSQVRPSPSPPLGYLLA
eukprot:tig00000331_g24159.t1